MQNCPVLKCQWVCLKHVSSASLEHKLSGGGGGQIITEIIIYPRDALLLAVYWAKWVHGTICSGGLFSYTE